MWMKFYAKGQCVQSDRGKKCGTLRDYINKKADERFLKAPETTQIMVLAWNFLIKYGLK